ncbi:MAG TPA: PD-(D/E)XK nuclease family protein, partial [Flavobacterium sp.]
MTNETFLAKLANKILSDYSSKLLDVTIILPNRRAKVFLVEELRLQAGRNIFAPKITSIEDFVQEISGIRSVDDIEILFEFYSVYSEITESPHRQSFD